MNGWISALERAEKEIVRLLEENGRLKAEVEILTPRGQPDEHVRDAVRALSGTEVHDPGNYVVAGPLGPLGVVPYIAADEARLVSLRPLAREIARRFEKVVLLAKFGSREDVERIEP